LSAARAEMLLVEEPGYVAMVTLYTHVTSYLEAENDKEKTYSVSQEEIFRAVDLQTTRKVRKN
jgi:hypothetical protein